MIPAFPPRFFRPQFRTRMRVPANVQIETTASVSRPPPKGRARPCLCVLRNTSRAEAPAALHAPFDARAAPRQAQWQKHLGLKLAAKNSIGIELVLIPPGSFKMGREQSLAALSATYPIIGMNADGDASFRDVIVSETPQHEVRLTRPYYLGKYNVTVAQFRAFVEATSYKTEAEKDGVGGWGYTPKPKPAFSISPEFNWRNTGFLQSDDSPVVNISWNDAVAFCRWLSKKERQPYRLPADAEWEYACRAGTVTDFATGTTPADLIGAVNGADIAYYKMLLGDSFTDKGLAGTQKLGMLVATDDGFVFTSPVGKFKPNAFGLFDMQGNASTWCGDWYAVDYYARSPHDDPSGPATGQTKIVRGGNWQYYPAFCRSASRFSYAPSRRETFLGLRVVREIR